ncbi:MAG: phosphatase PAP2 family protein [Gammaproteobacteria bacterium]|nr:phosphatase PAP2 family protein [Gammaproteobacteria bacterium]
MPRAWLYRLLAALALASPAMAALDEGLQQALYTWGGDRFPAAGLDWFKLWFHDAAKWPVLLVFLAALGMGLASGFSPRLSAWRRPLAVLLLGMGLGAGTVAALKTISPVVCPADDQAFGGELRNQAFWHWQLRPRPAGRCWPGGHASAGFCLIAGYYAARRAGKPHWARGTLCLALGYGNLLGIAQVLRGEHYLSHQLWTALICALAGLAADRLVYRRRAMA